MPFTFSHPAMVLPMAFLPKRFVSVSALVMGSMAPDFEYFIRMQMKQVHGHSALGVFYYDLPITLICLIIFHALIKKPLLEHMPDFIQFKYSDDSNWFASLKKRWMVILISSIAGIYAHLLWDSFTHLNGFFVERIPVLQSEITLFGVEAAWCDHLQIICSILGALLIVLVVLWPLKFLLSLHEIQRMLKFFSVVLLTDALVIYMRGVETFSQFIATSIAGFLIGILTAAVVFNSNPIILKKKVHEHSSH